LDWNELIDCCHVLFLTIDCKADIRGLRFDARLLLDTLSEADSNTSALYNARHSSEGDGWDDLPSDSEDVFFLGPSEIEDYKREKRRRILSENHQARMRALLEDEPAVSPEEKWPSDEEPDSQQKELMARTANHLASSPNAPQLEMRILANHGADPRFAFLRGRWKRAWALKKAQANEAGKGKEKIEVTPQPLLGGLTGYGSGSDDESEDETTGVPEEADGHDDDSHQRNKDDGGTDETVKEARRARAREWAERRRASKAQADTQ
jgi:hypothetical protein